MLGQADIPAWEALLAVSAAALVLSGWMAAKFRSGARHRPGDPGAKTGQNDAYPVIAAGATIRSEVRNLRRTQ